MARDIQRFNGETAEELPSLAEIQAAGQGLLVIALPHRLADLDQVMARFPGTQVIDVRRLAPEPAADVSDDAALDMAGDDDDL